MLSWTRLLSLVFLGLAYASPLSNFRVREALQTVPLGFTSVGPASPQQTLDLRLALAQADEEGLIDALYSVSDPTSPTYGEHLTKQEVESLVAPKPNTKEAVDAWLRANGLTASTLSPAGDWLRMQVPVSKANALFNANFTVFTHQKTGKQVTRTLFYSLPAALQGHVDLVYPTVSFPDSIALRTATKTKPSYHTVVQRDTTSSCANGTTPACLKDLYKIPTAPATHKKNSLGVTGFFGNVAHYEFLETFLKMFRPDMNPATNFTFVGIDGGVNDQTAPSVSEGELDIQFTVGLATDVPVTYYFMGPASQDGDLGGFLDEANFLLGLEQPPLVLTTSYGKQESSLSFGLTQKLCQVYAQLGARGTTILYAAGDSGPGCSETDPNAFAPTFPSNCPFVTSVGGTQGFAPEEAWTGSSGGFSNYYPIPAYQAKAISAYLAAHGSTNAGKFNASGRGFPDISAKADNFLVTEPDIFPLQGTSASSPTVASIIALLNDRLLAQGRPPLGFLNPLLYSTGKAVLTDITTGNSSIECSINDTTTRGFDAVPGWDPVTGLGTPRFDKFVEVLGL